MICPLGTPILSLRITDVLVDVPDRVGEGIGKRISTDKFAEVEDILSRGTFIAQKESSYMTGQLLGLSGGME